MLKNPVGIEGLVAWVETDDYGNVVDRLAEQGIKRGSVYVWTDPNDPGKGCQLVFSRVLTAEEDGQVNEWLVERFNPPMDQLPK